MHKLLLATALIEAGAGVALTSCPSATVALPLGAPLDGLAAVTLGRVAGVARRRASPAGWQLATPRAAPPGDWLAQCDCTTLAWWSSWLLPVRG